MEILGYELSKRTALTHRIDNKWKVETEYLPHPVTKKNCIMFTEENAELLIKHEKIYSAALQSGKTKHNPKNTGHKREKSFETTNRENCRYHRIFI
jgi:hypothetical protein